MIKHTTTDITSKGIVELLDKSHWLRCMPIRPWRLAEKIEHDVRRFKPHLIGEQHVHTLRVYNQKILRNGHEKQIWIFYRAQDKELEMIETP